MNNLSELIKRIEGIKKDLEWIEGSDDPEVLNEEVSDALMRLEDAADVAKDVQTKIEGIL